MLQLIVLISFVVSNVWGAIPIISYAHYNYFLHVYGLFTITLSGFIFFYMRQKSVLLFYKVCNLCSNSILYTYKNFKNLILVENVCLINFKYFFKTEESSLSIPILEHRNKNHVVER